MLWQCFVWACHSKKCESVKSGTSQIGVCQAVGAVTGSYLVVFIFAINRLVVSVFA